MPTVYEYGILWSFKTSCFSEVTKDVGAYTNVRRPQLLPGLLPGLLAGYCRIYSRVHLRGRSVTSTMYVWCEWKMRAVFIFGFFVWCFFVWWFLFGSLFFGLTPPHVSPMHRVGKSRFSVSGDRWGNTRGGRFGGG